MAKARTTKLPRTAGIISMNDVADNIPGQTQMAFSDDSAASGRSLEKQPVALPGAPRKPTGTLARAFLWIYGPQKIGKTTVASKFPGVWFLATEPGQDWVTVREPTIVHSWDEFLEWCSWIEENRPMKFADGEPIRFICIDTVDLLFRMCQEDVCRQCGGIDDPSELGHGKAWARLSNEFERVITKIRRWPFGLICISHSRDKQLTVRGQQKSRTEPDIGAAGMRTLSSASDLIVLMQSESTAELNAKGEPTGKISEQRVLITRPTSSFVAGGRMSDRLPEKLILDVDQPYESLLAAIKKGVQP